MSIKQTFSNIYDKNLWKNGSGPGSTPKATEEYRTFLIDVLQRYKFNNVLDYGCGDWQFSQLIPWNNLVENYTGVDLVDSVIENNKLSFSNEKINFMSIDSNWQWQGADLVICKDVLQHLSNDIVKEILGNMAHTCEYMLITNDVSVDNEITNGDCSSGKSRPLNLSLEPWNYTPIEKFTWQKTKNRIKETVLIKNEKR